MIKIIKKETKYKTVPDGTKDVVTYVASDGREFVGNDAEKKCAQHEKYLDYKMNWDKVIQIEAQGDIPELYNSWMYAQDEHQLELIKTKIGYYEEREYVRINDNEKNDPDIDATKILKIRNWITYRYEDGGDYRGTYHIYTLEYVKDEIQKFLNSFPKENEQ